MARRKRKAKATEKTAAAPARQQKPEADIPKKAGASPETPGEAGSSRKIDAGKKAAIKLEKPEETSGARKKDQAQTAGQDSRQRRGIAVSTCVAGMFLTLVLGIYLGTLLPGVVQDMQKTQQPVQKAAAREQEQPAMEPQLGRLVAELEKKAAANPGSAPDWINLGNIYFDAMRPEQAIAAYEHALDLAPKNADVLTDLGIMYRETGQFEKALESFRKAVAVNPRHENALFNQGVVLANDLRRNGEAIAAWKKLMEINPQAHAPDGRSLSEMIRKLE